MVYELKDYTGEVDPSPLLPKNCMCYIINKELINIVHLANKWQFDTATQKIIELNHDSKINMSTKDESLMLLSEILILNGNFQNAQDVMDKFLLKHPNDSQALFLSICVARQLGNKTDELYYYAKLKEANHELAKIAAILLDFIEDNRYRTDFEEEITGATNIDAILLYGNRMEKDGSMSKALKERLEKTLELSQRFPNADILASGGAAITPYSESEAMFDWLVNQGIDKERIYMDSVAKDTVGNVFGYKKLIEKNQLNYKNLCAVTSLSHLPRAWMSLVVCMERNNINFNNIYAAAYEKPHSIDIPREEIDFDIFTVIRSAERFDREKFKLAM